MVFIFDLKNFYHEKSRFGDYIAFNGTERFKNIIEKILDNPSSYDLIDIGDIKLDFDNQDGEEFEYRYVNKSERNAVNGVKYGWFIRYNFFCNKEEALRFNDWLFASATLIEGLIEKGIIKGEKIINEMPLIKEVFIFTWESSGGFLKITQQDKSKKSLLDKLYDVVKDHVADSLDKPSINVTDYKEKEDLINRLKLQNQELKTTINIIQKDIEQKIEDFNKDSEKLNEENIDLRQTIAKLKQEDEVNKNDLRLFFRALFPKFTLIRAKMFFTKLSSDHFSEEHVKNLSIFYKKIIEQKVDIEKIDGFKKVEGLSTWYQFYINVTVKDVNYPQSSMYDHQWAGGVKIDTKKKNIPSFYVCKNTEFGNDYFFIHFGEKSISYLENHDPPRSENKGI